MRIFRQIILLNGKRIMEVRRIYDIWHGNKENVIEQRGT